jgi:hypothetical protein
MAGKPAIMEKVEELEKLVTLLGFLIQAQNLGLVEPEDSTKAIGVQNWKYTSKGYTATGVPKPVGFDLDDFVDEFRGLFPKGVMSGGYYVVGDKVSCKRKLNKFLKDYKYTPEIILEATSRYIETMSKQDYKYMKIAPYFISKDGSSTLASECEAIEILGEEFKSGNSKTL